MSGVIGVERTAKEYVSEGIWNTNVTLGGYNGMASSQVFHSDLACLPKKPRQRGIEPVRFSLSDFRPCFAKSLVNTDVLAAVFVIAWTIIALRKLRSTSR